MSKKVNQDPAKDAGVATESQKAPKAEAKASIKFTVASRFTAKDQTQYEIGDDVSDFDPARLASLVERGLVKQN